MSTSKAKRRSLSGNSSSGIGFWGFSAIFAAVGGAVYFGKDIVGKLFSDRAEDKSLTEGTPESVARKLDSAMGYFSTNEDEMMRIASEEVPSQKFWEKVKSAYRLLYGKSLLDAIDGFTYGLDEKELKQFLAIINSKP